MPKNPQFSPDRRCVEILAFPQVQILDVAGPLQVFATANERLGLPVEPYALRVVAPGSEPVFASAGLGLAARPLPEADTPVDTFIVAGGPGVTAAASDPVLVAWVAARAARARRVASVCTGAFLLAATGQLDGRRVATHWAHCDRLKALHPRIRVEADPIFVRDGDVWTSAGVTAGIDLALALVEEDLGREAALAIARHLVMFLKRPGGQAQFSATLALQGGEERFAALHGWIGANLAGDLSLPALAAQAGMSERSLSRRYREATGMTPAKGVEHLRLEAARRALGETRAPVKRIARECGFGSEETLRRVFLRHVRATPQDYRARFGG